MMKKNFEDMYNRLHTIPACDGQTDRQTSCQGIVRAMHTRRAVKTVQCHSRTREVSFHKQVVISLTEKVLSKCIKTICTLITMELKQLFVHF